MGSQRARPLRDAAPDVRTCDPSAQDPLGFLPSVGPESRDPDVTMERRKVV